MMRMPVNLHFVSLIFLVTFKTVSSDIQPISITVQEGNSVTLNTTEKAQFHDFLWIKNNLDNIVLYDSKIENIYPSYKNRVDFNKQTLSITIKNMQKTDSGLYTAKASGKIDNIIGLYNLTVGKIPERVFFFFFFFFFTFRIQDLTIYSTVKMN
uniref:Immunoglobulin V-set domain-containing protein n=1 Tax=Cyprinus carpio TaxID=7962 RepID=A0A8C1LM77_CYPCA